ncbi:UNVERIFIED_CONTAM: Beta-1,6-galactosyltransferase GALT31A [Sesamum calycinum]|uniref:Hexosyltransferase n=1 Tax=Sesamum calycinum TaxID=2727403 RepID=A0AAW2LZM4_9LAMI
MGLMLGSRPPHKAGGVAGNVSGFSRRWVSLLCIASFCLGVVVVNRFWTVPDSVDSENNVLSLGKNRPRDIYPAINCDKKLGASETGNILSQVSKSHDIIMTLDKTISSLEMQLAAARAAKAEDEEKSKDTKLGNDSSNNRPKVFFVMGIITAFSSRKRRDSIRETWMPQGQDLKKLENEKGIIIRFVIGHSATPGGVLDRAIDAEEAQHKDFLRLNHVEGYHELSSKTQIYFSTAAAKWDADFYVKVDDDVHVNLGILGSLLSRHQSKPRVYIGCMKSGPVLAQKHILHRYANEDVSLGSWFIGLDVEHIDERSLCCGTPPIASGKHRRGTTVRHHLIGAVAAYASQLKEWKTSINVAVRVKEPFGTPVLEICTLLPTACNIYCA